MSCYVKRMSLISILILILSQNSFAIEREIFGIRLGEKLDTSSFSKEDDSYPPYIYVYKKEISHDVFKTLKVSTDIDDIVISIDAYSPFMQYDKCHVKGIALAKYLAEKYKKGRFSSDDYYLSNNFFEKANERAYGGCTESIRKTKSKYRMFLLYGLEDLTHHAKSKYKRKIKEEAQKGKSEFKGL